MVPPQHLEASIAAVTNPVAPSIVIPCAVSAEEGQVGTVWAVAEVVDLIEVPPNLYVPIGPFNDVRRKDPLTHLVLIDPGPVAAIVAVDGGTRDGRGYFARFQLFANQAGGTFGGPIPGE
jgi:hypothetical protein